MRKAETPFRRQMLPDRQIARAKLKPVAAITTGN